MARRRFTIPPVVDLSSMIYSVKAEDRVESNKSEYDGWSIFIDWCHQVPEGTRVELLRAGKVVAFMKKEPITFRPSESRILA